MFEEFQFIYQYLMLRPHFECSVSPCPHRSKIRAELLKKLEMNCFKSAVLSALDSTL